MKYIAILTTLLSIVSLSNAQNKSLLNGDKFKYADPIIIDEINNVRVFNSDSFISRFKYKIDAKESVLNPDDKTYPQAYVSNVNRNKYLKIWGGSDFGQYKGYGWFYSIGYLNDEKCSDCGVYLGKDTALDFIVNNGVQLGNNVQQVWEKMNLEYFRRFSFNGVDYFYYEKGQRNEVPFVPNQMFYFKFRKEKLIEFGFGYAMRGVNPMLHPE